MSTKNWRALLCILLFAVTAVPVQAGTHENDDCADEALTDDSDGTDCSFVMVPGTLHIKGVVSAGLGLCQVDEPTLPLFCDGDAGAGAIPGAGAVSFVDDDATPWVDGLKDLNVWVEVDPTFCIPPFSHTGTCGIDVTLCNDRDLNHICTDTGFAGDQLVEVQSNKEIADEGGLVPCEEQKKDSKPKEYCDPFSAEVSLCGLPNFALEAPRDWMPGQVVVFVGFWVDVVLGGNVGAGLTPGFAEVWLDANGMANYYCETNPCSECSMPSSCFWTLDDHMLPPGPMATTSSNACYAICPESGLLVVFVIEFAPALTTNANGCGVNLTANTANPVRAAVKTAGTYTCTVTWTAGAQGFAGCVDL